MTFAAFAAEEVLRKAAEGRETNLVDLWIAEKQVASAAEREAAQDAARQDEMRRFVTFGENELTWVPGLLIAA